jgi:hypothetical protein
MVPQVFGRALSAAKGDAVQLGLKSTEDEGNPPATHEDRL